MNNSKGNYLAIGVFILLLLGGLYLLSSNLRSQLTSQPTPGPSALTTILPSPSQVLGVRTKTTNCQSFNSLPDSGCTPGAVDPRVTQDNIQQTICVPGYTKTVRPPVSFTEPLKIKLLQEYGETDSPKNYELDHLISLELGGDPTSEANLWPEPYSPPPGAHEKDRFENFAHGQVCSGKMPVGEAQREISENWLKYWIEAGEP